MLLKFLLIHLLTLWYHVEFKTVIVENIHKQFLFESVSETVFSTELHSWKLQHQNICVFCFCLFVCFNLSRGKLWKHLFSSLKQIEGFKGREGLTQGYGKLLKSSFSTWRDTMHLACLYIPPYPHLCTYSHTPSSIYQSTYTYIIHIYMCTHAHSCTYTLWHIFVHVYTSVHSTS